MKDIKLTIIKVLSVLFAITLVALLASIAESHQLQSNLDRQTSNVGALTYDIKYDKLDDSLPVAKTPPCKLRSLSWNNCTSPTPSLLRN